MNAIEERELKLEVDADFELPSLPGAALESRVFASTYHDTPGLRLARVGITLRRRLENGKALWQLKLPRGDHRLELEQAGAPARPPHDLAKLLAGVVREEALGPVVTLRTRREGVRIMKDLQPVADVVLDAVSVLDAQRLVSTFRELEIELVDPEAETGTLERTLREAGARPGADRPKALRALGLEAEERAPQGDREVLSDWLRAQFLALVQADPSVRLGRDPEALHDLRVAVRRLRATMRAVGQSLPPEPTATVRDELRWLGGVLGPARDLDVLIAGLESAAEELGQGDRRALLRHLSSLRRERQAVAKAMLVQLDSPRYVALLNSLEELAEAGPERSPRLRKVARQEFAKLRAAMDALGEDPGDDALHKARIRAKRARYAAELAGQGAAGPRRVVARAKHFQDLVGAHQDAVVAEDRLRALALGKPDGAGALVLGRLIERQHARRTDARARLPKAWKKLERAGRRAW